jgi:hypothetical protein
MVPNKYTMLVAILLLSSSAIAFEQERLGHRTLERPTVLKSQQPQDVSNYTTSTYVIPIAENDTTAYNDSHVFIPHIDTDQYANAKHRFVETKKRIRREIANGLRAAFPRIRSLVTAFQDEEGFVRNGIVFCGAEHDAQNMADADLRDRAVISGVASSGVEKKPLEKNQFPLPANFSDLTGSLSLVDGWSDQSERFNSTGKTTQCGRSQCSEGSFVNIVSRFIRAHGYHVQHNDICQAFAETDPVITARTCNLREYPKERTAYECDRNASTQAKDWWQINKQCYGLSEKDCNSQSKCEWDSMEIFCRASETFMDAQINSNECRKKGDETIPASSHANEIWRVLGYSVQSEVQSVPTTDKAVVTGSIGNGKNETGCQTTRAFINAINGNAQVNAFRDLGIEEAVAQWNEELKGVRSYLTSLSALLTNFYPTTLTMFPFIENEELDECPMGDIERNPNTDSGTEEQPLCEQVDFQTYDKLNRINEAGQSMLRTSCFCRNGVLEIQADPKTLDWVTGTSTASAVDQHYTIHEFDQIYLEPNPNLWVLTDDEEGKNIHMVRDMNLAEADRRNRTTIGCSRFKDQLPSVYTYCTNIKVWGDTAPWQRTLDVIRPNQDRIKVRKGTQHSGKKAKIIELLERTLPEVENSCGRVVTAHNNASMQLMSNKGGNCVPFEKLHEVIYRVEFETAMADAGLAENTTVVYREQELKTSASMIYRRMFCASTYSHTNSKFSFRQMSYLWDHIQGGSSDPQYAGITASNQTSLEFRPDGSNAVPYNYFDHETTIGAFPENQRYSITNRSFCYIDWIGDFSGASTRQDSFGDDYVDPYLLYDREIEEAIWNTAIAISSKKKVILDNLELWDVLEQQLTTPEDGNMLSSLAHAATKHFMKVVQTDDDGDRVDYTPYFNED